MKEKKMTKAKPKSEFYKNTSIPNTLLDELMHQLPTMPTQEDLFGPEGVVKQLSAALIERCLQAELSTHLGYEKNQRGEEAQPNHRNGYSRKTLKSDAGEVELAIPRDREGSSDPLLVKRGQTSLTGFVLRKSCGSLPMVSRPATFRRRSWTGTASRSRLSSFPM
jgi:hypothetical protein